MLSDADRALGLLADLRELGVRLSLDDFGTGYSSLTHLSELPIQQLKVDRSFVSQVHEAGRDRAIVAAVADLAGHLDLEVVAEGIETPETAQLLASLGCELGQGHYFAAVDGPGAAAAVGADPRPALGVVRARVAAGPAHARRALSPAAAGTRRKRLARGAGGCGTLVAWTPRGCPGTGGPPTC